MGEIARMRLRAGKGTAPTVLFVHGLDDGWRCWEPVIEAVGTDLTCDVLDLPWRAGSDHAWRSQPEWSRLMADLRSRLAAADAVVAHSFGASTVLELLATADELRSLPAVLVCPLYWPPGDPVSPPVVDRARAAFEEHIAAGVRARLGPRAARCDADVVDGMIRRAVSAVGLMGFQAVLERYIATRCVPLGQIGGRIVVICAQVDSLLSLRSARALTSAIPRAELRSGGYYHDHFCHISQPRHIADEVIAMVGQLAQDKAGSAAQRCAERAS